MKPHLSKPSKTWLTNLFRKIPASDKFQLTMINWITNNLNCSWSKSLNEDYTLPPSTSLWIIAANSIKIMSKNPAILQSLLFQEFCDDHIINEVLFSQLVNTQKLWIKGDKQRMKARNNRKLHNNLLKNKK